MKLFVILHLKAQLVEKGWCNENASTINLECNEIFIKGLPKNLKDYATKRQVKPTSTVLEPSIPFHTLIKLVDAEDIANDKIRTHDLTLEVNNITKQLQTQTLDSQHSDQVMFTQPRDPKNKAKPTYKKYYSYCNRTNHSISACFKIKNEMMKINVILMQDQSLLKNFLYNIFVLPPMIKHQDMIQDQMTIPLDIIVEVQLVMIIKNPIILIIDNDLLLELATIMIELLLLHIIRGLGRTTIKEILAHIVHHTDLLTDHLKDVIHVPDINVDLTPEITTFKDILLLTDPLPDLEILDILDLVHILVHETKLTIFNRKVLQIQSTLKYTCITQQKWQIH